MDRNEWLAISFRPRSIILSIIDWLSIGSIKSTVNRFDVVDFWSCLKYSVKSTLNDFNYVSIREAIEFK